MEHDSTNGTTETRPLDDLLLDDLLLDGIPVDGIEATYDARGLDRLSDGELVAAVAAVVAEPREGPADSFVLHSPLELTARARLLARTPASHRRLARLRLVSIAARYQRYPPAELATLDAATGTGIAAGPGPADPTVDAVLGAIDAGDLEGVDAAVQRLAASGPDPASILGPLAAAVAKRTAAAAHGPIFLATLAETPDHAPGWLPLLRPLTRELARRPDWAITWMDRAGSSDTATNDPEALFVALADPPRLGPPGSSFIHPLLMQVDAPGIADAVLGPIVGPGRATPATPARSNQDAANAITRIAALAMVRDDPSHAPYGWTHCLTLPQAILTLAPHIDRGDRPGSALVIAATQVLAFRAAQGSVTLDPTDELLTPADHATADARAEALIIEAARRHDAHIAKYILASLTAAATDPEASELHLTAAEHLLAVWDDLGPDPDDVLGSVALS